MAEGVLFSCPSLIRLSHSQAIQDGLQVTGPIILQYLLANIQKGGPTWYTAVMIVLMAVLEQARIVYSNLYFHRAFRVSMGLKTGVIDMIFRKSLLISGAVRGELGLGKIINFQSNDGKRIWETAQFLHQLWSAPEQVRGAGLRGRCAGLLTRGAGLRGRGRGALGCLGGVLTLVARKGTRMQSPDRDNERQGPVPLARDALTRPICLVVAAGADHHRAPDAHPQARARARRPPHHHRLHPRQRLRRPPPLCDTEGAHRAHRQAGQDDHGGDTVGLQEARRALDDAGALGMARAAAGPRHMESYRLTRIPICVALFSMHTLSLLLTHHSLQCKAFSAPSRV